MTAHFYGTQSGCRRGPANGISVKREAWPRNSSIADSGEPKAAAHCRITSVLAGPLASAAVMRMLMMPSAMPAIAERLVRDVTVTRSRDRAVRCETAVTTAAG